MKVAIIYKGGSGSGNFNHVGRPGEVGGSGDGGSGGKAQERGYADIQKDVKKELNSKHEDSLDVYSTEDYKIINEYVRTGKCPKTSEDEYGDKVPVKQSEIDYHIKNLDQAIKMNSLTEDTFLYRGIVSDRFNTTSEGKTFLDRGFMSTTNTIQSAKQFLDFSQETGKGSTILSIRAPKGTNFALVDAENQENEVLLGRGNEIKVVGHSNYKGYNVIEADLL